MIKIRPVVPGKNAKKVRNFETLQLAVECHSMNKNKSLIKIRPVVLKKNTKMWRKFRKFTIGCRMSLHVQKSKFHQDKTRSSWENAKKWENLETLQLAAEGHSINKNQSLIKIKPVFSVKIAKTEKFVKLCNWLQNATAWTKIKVGWRPVVLQKNAKKWENFETLQLAAEWHSINKNKSLIKITPIVPENMQKSEENLETFASGCRMPQHKQKSKFDQDETSCSWEKFQKVKKIWKHCKWLQSATA